MKKTEELKKQLDLKFPIWGYSPKGLVDPQLAIDLSKQGGVGLIDLENLKEGNIKEILTRCYNNIPRNNLWGIRVSSKNQLIHLDEIGKIPIVIIGLQIEDIDIQDVREKCKYVIAEVISLHDAKNKDHWADFFLVKGKESGGLIGETTSFIQIQSFYEAGYPFIIQGGFGVYNAISALIGGSLGIVYESQLYLLPECPLDDNIKKYLEDLDENDSYIVGESFNTKYRLAGKIANRSIRNVKEIEKNQLSQLDEEQFFNKIKKMSIGHRFFQEEEIKDAFLPLDCGIGFAQYIKDKFGNLEGFLHGLYSIIGSQIINVKADWPFSKNSDFTKHFGIEIPVIQGPMANISDNVDFANKISNNGALPIIALGGLLKEEVKELFETSDSKLQNIRYGCGIIGLEAIKERREDQLEIMQEYKPDYVLIAAGTIDLALKVAQLGFKTLFHTPALSMFKEAIKNELDNLVLEGSECGGHIGIATSFILWEKILEYLDTQRSQIKQKLNLIFAGGISDSLSTVMVAGMIGKHLDLINPGIQMGTAYLLTEEIVSTRALSAKYQEILLNTKQTKVIGASVNTRARVASSPFVESTLEKELSRVKVGLRIAERKELYEKDNLGALRIASKAEKWNTDHTPGSISTTQFISVSENDQEELGCFMTGDIVTIKRNVNRISDIHYNVIEGGEEYAKQVFNILSLPDLDVKTSPVQEPVLELETVERIAIVGLGCVFPDALNIDEFWNNLITKRYSISEIPKDRWDPAIFFDKNIEATDKTYTKIGAFVKKFKFNSIKYRIPPTIADRMDFVQKWSLDASKQALEDAGIPTNGKIRLNIATIIGNALGGENQRNNNKRLFFPEVVKEIRNNPIFQNLDDEKQDTFLSDLKKSYLDKYPEITEDTMPGELSNIIAGRIANVFNLTGKSMTTDAACASSIAAVDTAVNGLLAKNYDVVLVGGADRSMDITSYVKFSKIRTLSATGSRPFDAKADGFVMGEGAGFMVLKRLSDALKDGDKIYSIISSIGSSSDGKGKGITAPNPEGQKQAILMAIKKAKITLNDIDYIEAHGTSTIVGDQAELLVLEDIFSKSKRTKKIAVGSIKSQIGHMKSAAGIASLIKTVLALYKKKLLPSVNVNELNPNINWEKSLLYINTELKEWKIENVPIRRAGVSAFGFGGANYHTILEEYSPKKVSYFTEEKIIQLEASQILSPQLDRKQDMKTGQICFLFTGQGSQYLGMINELYDELSSVKNVINSAEKICQNFGQFNLKEILFGSEHLSKDENEARLRDTKYTQPALFVVEIALFELLKEKGILPSKVAGHSLGEYSALVAADVITFQDGLKAVIARGRAMGTAAERIKGAMAAIFASAQEVREVVDSISDFYVTIANYNSTTQTVISGEERGIDKAIELFSLKGINAKKLNVSTAFHSKIVKEAEKGLENLLSSLDYNKPSIPVYCNVTGKKHSENPEEIRSLLLQQISSSVKWIDEIRNMQEDGGRIFVEVGPRRALANFAQDILKEQTNVHFFSLLSPKESEIEKTNRTVKKILEIVNQQKKAKVEISVERDQISAFGILEDDIEFKELSSNPYFSDYLREHKNLIKSFFMQSFDLYDTKYRESLDLLKKHKALKINTGLIGITGVGIGIPGKTNRVFDDQNIDRILSGENLIDAVDYQTKQKILDKNIIRLVKSPDGNATFENIDDISKVISLAGQLGSFDLEKDYNINPKLLNALDSTFQLAIGAGYEALRDAGIPLVKTEIMTTTGKVIQGDWALPEDLREDTGIIFASAFPGYNNLIKEISNHFISVFEEKNRKEIETVLNLLSSEISNVQIKEELRKWYNENLQYITNNDNKRQFSRDFIYKILSMGHSQFAQLIKAKGPNTQINSACASTTQAIGVAEDWIRNGRCKRVIVIAGDNASSPDLLPWIGAGFLAAGGVSTKAKVEEAALPFGKNRHGLLIGAAAAGLIIESSESFVKRGVKPIVDLLGTFFSNNAFHGSRLDVDQIYKEMEKFVVKMEDVHNISRKEIAKNGMFVSHETYTPARGGSAEAEIVTLERVFGKDAYDMTIINTKGFTGHAMGAGLEECIAIKSMEKGKLPPIANLKEIDPAFTKFKFSKGEEERKKYALKFAAGFGSQLAFALFRLNSYKDRFISKEYDNWLSSLGGNKTQLHLEGRVLRLKTVSHPSSAEVIAIKPKPITMQVANQQVMTDIITIISKTTGYDTDSIEVEMDLEEDLGIDTIKQAEIFGEIRDKFNMEMSEDLSLAEYRTVEDIATFVNENLGNEKVILPIKDIEKKQESSNIDVEIVNIISKITGYEPDVIDLEMDLEEDLGIDTIKQVEIFGEIRDKFTIKTSEDLSLAEYRTVKEIVGYVNTHLQGDKQVLTTEVTVEVTTEVIEEKQESSNINIEIVKIISKITGYEPNDIDLEMDLEEDLGIDTIKQVEIFGEVRNVFGFEISEDENIGDIRTITDIRKFVDANLTVITQTPEEVIIETKEESLESEISAREVSPVQISLDKETAEVVQLTSSEILVIDLSSNITKELLKELNQQNCRYNSVDILNYKLDEVEKRDYDLILLTPPSLASSAGLVDQQYFEQLFLLFQALEISPKLKIAIISTEEMFGLYGNAVPVSGGISGFVKTLGFEFDIKVKHIYSSSIKKILLELEYWDDYKEIAYKDSKRFTLQNIQKLDLNTITEKNQITNEDLILVLGGGRGITFECIKRLCQKSKPKLALFGIERLPEDMDEVVWYSDEILKVKKQELKVELQSKHEKVTPVILEREWQRFLSQIEVAKNMLYLYEQDIEANFYSVDVRNVNSIKEALEQVKEDFDIPITVLVHAAGLEESKSFKKKKIEKSRVIVSVKVEGIWNVLNNIDQTQLKRVICFSSIAGRFGNTGQIDYSFANGYLSRMCWMLSQKGIPSLAINWSAWADIGMATKGSILDILQSVGITPIPPKEGTKKFVELLEKDIDNEVIVAGKLGFMTENEQEIAKPPSDDFPVTDKIVQNDFPMIDTTYQKEGKIVGNRILSFQNDLFLQDHQIQNIPIFPGVMGLETFAEMFKIINKSKPNEFNDIGFNLAIKQKKKEDKEILVEYNPERGHFSVKTLFTPKVKNAKTIEKEHFVASIKESKKLPKVKQLKILERKTSLLTKSDIYDMYFHRKSFQVIDELQEIKNNIVLAKISIPQFPLFKNKDQQLEISPLAVEAALQTAGLYDLIINKQFSLPSTIKKLTILNESSPAYAKAEFVKSDKTTSYFNVWITDKEGNVIIILDKLGMIHTRIPLDLEESIKNKIEEISEYYQINSQFSEKKVRIVPISTIAALYEKEPNFVESWLVAHEKSRYSRIANQKRKIEYIAGVLAAKELYSTVSEFEDYKEIEIKKQVKGQPFLYSRKDKKRSDWNLSISHSGKYAIATISKDPIGIDIEKIEERKPSFYEEAFTENERENISGDKVLGTQYWTVKEAVTKALGEGLNMKLHDIELSSGGKEKEFSVDFVSKVKDSLKQKSNSFIIENKLVGEYSISVCEIKQDDKNDEEKEV